MKDRMNIADTEHNIQSVYEVNAELLSAEMAWFAGMVNKRLSEYFLVDNETGDNDPAIQSKSYFGKEKEPITVPPDIANANAVYAEFVRYYQLNPEERILLMLTLLPHIQPHFLDVFLTINKKSGRNYTEFGGVKGNAHGGFIPTIETAMFIIAGNNLADRFALNYLFERDHFFFAHHILELDTLSNREPFYSSAIAISDEYVNYFTTGKIRKPDFSIEFPAKQLHTKMEWDELVLDEFTMLQLDELRKWLQYNTQLYIDWELDKKIKPGYKALFYGPPGTGKTLTAALLGKQFGLDVYRIDLSMVVSKYIGETEKNLEKVFKKAENKNWILFFDEADALFGKRTGVSDARDKYANQEISYLLQRLEEFKGLVILASNMRNNIDEAFTRRLNAIIHFQKPQPKERLLLWQNGFSKKCIPPTQMELEQIASQFELSGGAIINVVQYASLMALARKENKILLDDVITGIKKEFRKEGRTL